MIRLKVKNKEPKSFSNDHLWYAILETEWKQNCNLTLSLVNQRYSYSETLDDLMYEYIELETVE